MRRRTSPPPSLALATATALLSLALTSCAADTGDAGGSRGDGGSCHSDEPTPGATIDLEDFAPRLECGEFDTVHVEIAASGQPLSTSIDFDASGQGDPRLHTVIRDGEQDGEAIEIDGVLYRRLPGAAERYVTSPTSGTGPWGLGLDSDSVVKDLVYFFVDVDHLVSVTFVGTQQIDGVPVQHFTVMDESRRPVSIYLDDEGRLVRVARKGRGGVLTETFSRYDEPMDIAAPTDVVDRSDLASP